MKKLFVIFVVLLFPFLGFGATFYYNGIAVPLSTTQQTHPAIAFNVNGTVWYASLADAAVPGTMAVDYNNVTYSIGKWVLYHDQTTINSCGSVSLPGGYYYKVEVMGGTGGTGGSSGDAGLNATAYVSSAFLLTNNTTVSVFRGGNGNNGNNGDSGGNAGSNGRGAGSGAASGAPSAVIVNGKVYKSEGGGGGRGGVAKCYNGSFTSGGAGGGGGSGYTNGLNAHYNYALNNDMCISGAGGGGAPNGPGGVEISGTGYGGGVGGNGSASIGGGGGSAWRLTSKETGGNGGASVTWSCGGQTLYSYGGGGAGAINLRATSTFNKNGVAGGTGSTGSSSTSYAKIYRFE